MPLGSGLPLPGLVSQSWITGSKLNRASACQGGRFAGTLVPKAAWSGESAGPWSLRSSFCGCHRARPTGSWVLAQRSSAGVREGRGSKCGRNAVTAGRGREGHREGRQGEDSSLCPAQSLVSSVPFWQSTQKRRKKTSSPSSNCLMRPTPCRSRGVFSAAPRGSGGGLGARELDRRLAGSLAQEEVSPPPEATSFHVTGA